MFLLSVGVSRKVGGRLACHRVRWRCRACAVCQGVTHAIWIGSAAAPHARNDRRHLDRGVRAGRSGHRDVVVDQVVQAGSFGVQSHRLGALERVGWVLADWDAARANRAVVEQRMVGVLDELDLTNVVCTIPGLSGRCGGDPRRNRGPAPVHVCPRRGQACRARTPRTPVGDVHRQGASPVRVGSAWPRGGPSSRPCAATRLDTKRLTLMSVRLAWRSRRVAASKLVDATTTKIDT